MIIKVVEAVARRSSRIEKGVEEIIGGKVLDYEEKTIFRRGEAAGKQEGRNELVNAIQALKSGKTERELMLDGVPEEVIEQARICLS